MPTNRERRPLDDRSAPRTPTSKTPASPMRKRIAVIVLITAIVTYAVVMSVFSDQVRGLFMGPPCRLTTCAAPAMAVGGWLVPVLLLGWICLGYALWPRFNEGVKAAWSLLGVAVGGLTWLFVPPNETAMWSGPGGSATATGLRWGMGSLALTVAVILLLRAKKLPFRARLHGGRRWPAVVAAICALSTLGVATARAESRPISAAEVLPGRFAVDGVWFTVQSSRESNGCAGVIANEPLLRGCMRTVRTVVQGEKGKVHLAAVLFASSTEAWSRWQDLPEGSGQQGFLGDALSVTGVIGGWVLLSTVETEDGKLDAVRVVVQFQRRQGDHTARTPSAAYY